MHDSHQTNKNACRPHDHPSQAAAHMAWVHDARQLHDELMDKSWRTRYNHCAQAAAHMSRGASRGRIASPHVSSQMHKHIPLPLPLHDPRPPHPSPPHVTRS